MRIVDCIEEIVLDNLIKVYQLKQESLHAQETHKEVKKELLLVIKVKVKAGVARKLLSTREKKHQKLKDFFDLLHKTN